MSEGAKRFLEQAMSLPASERLALAEQLVASVAETEPSTRQQAWLEELDRRRDRVRASTEPSLNLEEVQQRLRSLASP